MADSKIWRTGQRTTQAAKAREAGPEGSPRLADTFTRLEKTLINYVMHSWYVREISHQLSLPHLTVTKHLRSIYDRVGVSNRLELVLHALHARLDLPPLEPLGTPLDPR